MHLDLDLGLTDRQREKFLHLIEHAGRRLRERGTITASDAAQWDIAEGCPVIWRGAPSTAGASVAELGEALIGLVRGTLPHPPPGTWWFIGMSGGPATIAMTGDEAG